MKLVSDRRYDFGVGVEEVWAALADVERYPLLWPWMRHFEARALAVGDHWRCVVHPPLPYSVRVGIRLVDVVDRTRVVAAVDGDVTGSARIDLEVTAGGSAIRLRSTLAPNGRVVGVFATVMRPVVRRGHDWVLDTGAAQFAASVAAGHDETGVEGEHDGGGAVPC